MEFLTALHPAREHLTVVKQEICVTAKKEVYHGHPEKN